MNDKDLLERVKAAVRRFLEETGKPAAYGLISPETALRIQRADPNHWAHASATAEGFRVRAQRSPLLSYKELEQDLETLPRPRVNRWCIVDPDLGVAQGVIVLRDRSRDIRIVYQLD